MHACKKDSYDENNIIQIQTYILQILIIFFSLSGWFVSQRTYEREENNRSSNKHLLFWRGVKACQYDVGHSLCIITATINKTKCSRIRSVGDGICNIV